jgi:choline dehydrogenase-like flavoprotein
VLYLRFLVETQPMADNTVRVREIDGAGQALPQITLRYPDYMKASIERVVSHIRRRLPRADVKVLSTSPTVQHWMGATRMADSAADGCVDRHLRYHDLENLYVLSGSTFPSSSSANPTMTISALALRLGDHLKT